MMKTLTQKTETELHEFMEIDPLPQARIDKIKIELGTQLKTEICNMSPLLRRQMTGSVDGGSSIGEDAGGKQQLPDR